VNGKVDCPGKDEMNESTLIRRFTEKGDRRAFEKLLARYQSRIFSFGFRMCGHREDAEDVVQDTFVSAYRHMKGFRGEGSLVSWLLKIASSACLKKRRRKKNEPKSHLEYDEIWASASGVAEDAGKLLTPDALVMSAETREQFHLALSRLPQHYKIVLVLRDIEGLSVKETASTLDLTESAVKVRLHRARAKLYNAFSEIRGEGEVADA